MVMPLAGTFHYTGVVPATQAERESGLWRMKQQRDPPSQLKLDSHKFWQFWQRDSVRQAAADHLRDARLVGFEPTLRISGIRLILEAHSRHLSQLRSASLELDAALIETFEAGDLLTLVRTPTADIAVGVERQRRLIAAIGAVTVIPLGDMVAVVGGPTIDISTPDRWPRSETWVDVSVSGETRRLHGGDDVTIRDYCVSVIRTFEDGVPGDYECLAISLKSLAAHGSAVRSAQKLAAPGAGLLMTSWS